MLKSQGFRVTATKVGGVKGDFSRFTYDPRKHYTGVFQQRGRVQLDSDWNEQVEICAHRDAALAADLIGPCGAPRSCGGFAVSCTDDGDLKLSAGRLYVAGTLCELDAATTYSKQPDFPSAPAISPAAGRTDLVYLDVWQRHVTALEDPDLRDPALGGPDTATRARTVWQAKIFPDVQVAGCQEPIDGWPPPASAARLSITIGARGVERPPSGQTSLPSTGGYRGLENSLYRVEIHDGGAIGAATFKWSRDNGSFVLAVRELLPGSNGAKVAASVEPIGPGGLALEKGDWLEALDDQRELAFTPGKMVRVERVDPSEQVVWLDRDLSPYADESHLKLRRWQGGGVLDVTQRSVELEDGVVVSFSGGSFRTGDYWAFPARPASDTVQWPAVPPRGIHHRFGKLALVTWEKGASGSLTAAVTDCRPLFGSLAGVRSEACEPCRHEIAELRAKLEQQALELAELKAQLA